MTYVSKDLWQSEFKDWTITDVAVRDRNIVCLCLRKHVPQEQASEMWDHDIETTLINLFINRPEKPFGARSFTGFNKPRVGACTLPISQALLVARNNDGQVSLLGGGRDFPDEFIDPGKVPMTWRIKTLGGYAYSVGAGRAIYKRADIGKWVKLDGFPKVEATSAQGFEDMDAFSDTDMYAVGGHGDVWHFNGQRWRQLGFPTNVQLGTVTCAGDGQVYISGEGGSLWVGRDATWKRVYQGGASILWNDVLWFQDRLWLASDYQFRVWNGKSLEPVAHRGEEVYVSGHMDARDGLLAIASQEVVMCFDGQDWRTIVAPYL